MNETTKPSKVTPKAEQNADFEALLNTAGLSAREVSAKPGSPEYPEALSQLYQRAVARWGLGLHHLPHSVTLEGGQITLHSGNTHMALEGAPQLSRQLASLQAIGERGLSEWPALSDGWRAKITSRAQLRTLIEDARDFETLWDTLRGDFFYRVWRSGETLFVEVCRPVDAAQLLADAAWDVMTSIKDRNFVRELMERSKEGGLLAAVLSARHKGAGAALEQHYGAHFTVQAVVSELSGQAGRDFSAYQAALKEAVQQLSELQQAAVSSTAAVLRGDLR